MAVFRTAGIWGADNGVTELWAQNEGSQNGPRRGLETGHAPAVAGSQKALRDGWNVSITW